ncbi:hypothetical protein BN000_00277 [Neobacillus massiliamazoniensis]|uniref:Uncharacterized protein n=1 Tax=Neobacillus massiliamazoniensis TaxID=1499688 RepID=A0A0U1NQT8_9BACI|nr:hypothetical protein BN000_00277 [Neobacillus massiliamazoniensis]
MAIRYRGKIKWQPASFIPLAFEMQRSMYKDQERKPKPIIDAYGGEEFAPSKPPKLNLVTSSESNLLRAIVGVLISSTRQATLAANQGSPCLIINLSSFIPKLKVCTLLSFVIIVIGFRLKVSVNGLFVFQRRISAVFTY